MSGGKALANVVILSVISSAVFRKEDGLVSFCLLKSTKRVSQAIRTLTEKRIIMTTTLKHLPSGQSFENRKEAKLVMGHGEFNRALKNGEFMFISTYSPLDIII